MNDKAFTDNTGARRYELAEGGQVVFAAYRRDGRTIYIDHVETPEAMRGAGAAGRLMQAVADHARAERLRIVPVCPYAVAWLRKHAEYNDLTA